jgi:cysteinyl-tRNA synthetase
MDSVLSVLGRNDRVVSLAPAQDPEFTATIESLLTRRAEARAAKDWATSDRIRKELAALGVSVKDGSSGAT